MLLIVCVILAQDAGESSRKLYNAGKKEQNDRAYEKAIATFTSALRFSPNDDLVQTARGECYTEIEEYDAAVADFSAVLKRAPKDRQALEGRASAKCAMGDGPGALADVESAISAGENSVLLYKRAFIKSSVGDPKGAIADYTRLIGMGHAAYCDRGWERWKHGDKEGAEEDFQEAAKSKGQDKWHVYYRGRARFEERKWSDAIKLFDEFVGSDRTASYALLLRGAAHFGLDSRGDAAADFDRVATTSSSVDAQLLSWFLSSTRGSRPEADKSLKSFLKKRGTLKTRDWFAKTVAFVCGELKEKEFLKAAETKYKPVTLRCQGEAHFWIGCRLLLEGDKDRALPAYQKAAAVAELDPVLRAMADVQVAQLMRK